MPSPTRGSVSRAQSPSPDLEDLEHYPTLKQSLSASFTNGFESGSPRLAKYFGTHRNEPQSTKTTRSSPPISARVVKAHSAVDTALAALQYLPIPLLVLSNSKVVVLANEAVGDLLGLTCDGFGNRNNDSSDLSAADLLRGQTLSQIGIDIIQDGQSIWVSWERFLDDLADDEDDSSSEWVKLEQENLKAPRGEGVSPSLAPTAENETHSGSRQTSQAARSKGNSHTQNTVLDVVLSSQYIGMSAVSSTRDHKSSLPDGQVQAEMTVSIWNLEGVRYYTLSFTNVTTSLPPLDSPPSNAHESSSIPTPPVAALPTSPPSLDAAASCPTCGACALSVRTAASNTAFTIFPFPQRAASNSTSSLSSNVPSVAITPSLLQKTSRMKDAILNTMEIPVFAMWRDGSLTFPNRAAVRLLQRHVDPTNEDSYDLLSRMKAWTEDFSRELRQDEYPVVQLCNDQKPFKGRRIGVMDPQNGRTVYDCSGEGYFDEITGEFVAGIVALKDVTEYTSALKSQSEENEQQFQLICHTTPNMLWTTAPNGMHDWFSNRWYDYTGLTQEQSLGTGWQTPFHPEDMPETSRRWAHSLATGEAYSTEYRCQRHDGQWRWMLGRAQPLRDSRTGKIVKWMGSLSDIHDLVEARQAAKRTREQLLNVIKHAQVTVWAIDRHRRLTFLEGKLMWGMDQDDITYDHLGCNIYDVFGRHKGEADLPLYRKPIEDILNGNTKEQISEHHIDGNGRWFRTRFVPILGKKVQGGKVDEKFVDGVVGVSMDVSELKERQAEVQSREEENTRLLSAETAAKEASRLKSQFLANMSHEIRTPIAGIIGMAELLIDTDLDQEQRDFGENIQRSANGLLTVINDILDLSKVESGRLDIEEVQFSLSIVLQDVCKMMSFAAGRKNLTFESNIQIGRNEDLIVLGDPGRCRQILTNLLTNSIKFTSVGSVKLSVATKHENNESIEVLFSVEDTGIGIEEDVRKRLFKPFSQADSSTARRFGGTGLGLTICKNLVGLMHGEITLESVLGSGTKAAFTIPFNKPEKSLHGGISTIVNLDALPNRLQSEASLSGCTSDQSGQSPTPPQSPLVTPGRAKHNDDSPPNASLTRPSLIPNSREHETVLPHSERINTHVLVVEDNAINQQIALKTIKKLGFRVTAVWNGREALDYLTEAYAGQHPKPDLILMDVQMPILDGYRATHLIRHHNPYASLPGMRAVPIVAMTASAIQGDKEKCERAGMDDYLAKPVKGKVLENMLVKWALKSKRHFRHNISYHSPHTDHDSNCAESEQAPSLKAFSPPLEIAKPFDENVHSRTIAETGYLPGAESEGERGLRRVAAEEKAAALRNDKLINTANEEHMLNHHTTSRGSDDPPLHPEPSTAALTVENIGKLGLEQDIIHPQARSKVPSNSSGERTTSSLLVEGRPLSSSSTLASLKSLNDSLGPKSGNSKRNRLPRNDSELSEMTVTPQSSMETDGNM